MFNCLTCTNLYTRTGSGLKGKKQQQHMRNGRDSNIAKHAWSLNNSTDFKNSQVFEKGSFSIHKTQELWLTALINHADKNSRPRPINTPFFQKKRTVYSLTLVFLPFYCIIYTSIYFCTYSVVFGRNFSNFSHRPYPQGYSLKAKSSVFKLYIFSPGLASSSLKLFLSWYRQLMS